MEKLQFVMKSLKNMRIVRKDNILIIKKNADDMRKIQKQEK